MKFRNVTRLMKNAFVITIIIFMVIHNSSSSTQESPNTTIKINGFDEYLPSQFAELTNRTRTANFIDSLRAVPENNASSIDTIYYRLRGLQFLDPSLANLTSEIKNYWVDQILSFQNSNGGFGGWKYDIPSISHTARAIEALSILGYNFNNPLFNVTLVLEYVESLRNSLTLGYNSHSKDTDSDIFSTYYGVITYDILGQTMPSISNATDLFINAQNLDSNFVPSSEIGGFGEQTNSQKDIYWTSKVTVSTAALNALQLLSSNSDDDSALLNFLQSVQAIDGGFTNDPYVLNTNIGYTASALEGIYHLAGTPTNATKAEEFVISLEMPDGGFKYQSTSTSSDLKSSFFAVEALDLLGSQPSNITKTIEYFTNWALDTDGFSGTPGEEPTLRETFDAVAALTAMGRTITNPTGITDFVNTYRQVDGGYGLLGSYIDSTSRAVNIYKLLGIDFPNPSETISFVKGLQRPSGAFAKSPYNSTSLVVSTYRSVVILSELSSSPTNTQIVIDYLKSTQNQDGGFGGFVGDTSDVSSTYRAVKAMNILGDNTFNSVEATSFLRASQNLDGGFKRSSYDNLRPNNVSHAVYTYSSILALQILGSSPDNVSNAFDYITNLRNTDGGYAKHPDFTSDAAYTFTSVTLLSIFHEISGFKVLIPDNLENSRTDYSNFNITIEGGVGGFELLLTNSSDSEILNNSSFSVIIDVPINTTMWSVGTRTLNFEVIDFTGAIISFSFDVYIEIPESPNTSSPNNQTSSSTNNEETPQNTILGIDQNVLLIIAGGIVGITILGLFMTKRGNK